MPQVAKVKGAYKTRVHLKGVALFVIIFAAVLGSLLVGVKLSEPKITMAAVPGIAKQAEALAGKGNLAGALELYDKAIARADGDITSGNLYEGKAVLQMSRKNWDGALKDALKAEKRLQRSGASALVGDIYAAKGDKAQAITYYQAAAGKASSNGPAGPSKSYYENKVAALEKATK